MKSIIIILIFLLLILPIISAVEFQFVKDSDSFDQGETLLAIISGNFLKSIVAEDVFFFRGHVRIPIIYEVVEINDDFYIYALLGGKEQANYSIVVKNTKFMKGIEISEEELVKNFTITENTAIFSINPGFVKTSEDFFVEVQNLQDNQITIQINTDFETPYSNSTNLKSGEIKKLDFKTGIAGNTLRFIDFSSDNFTYQLPVFITTNETIPEEGKERNFRFEPSILDISMATNSDARRIIYLRNTGEEDLENVFLFVSPILEPYVSFSIEEINDLEKNSSEQIELFFLSDEEEFIIEGEIIAQAENISTSLTIVLNFIKDFIPLDEDARIEVSTVLTCAEVGGVICAENEECSEDVIYTSNDDVCCLADCGEIEESSKGRIIGWALLILIIGILFWFYKRRYKGVKRKVDLSKIARGKK